MNIIAAIWLTLAFAIMSVLTFAFALHLLAR
jgi:hypothetical protein